MSFTPKVIHSENLAAEGARFIVEAAEAAIKSHGLFRLGLAGGGTPKAVYAELAKTGAELPWKSIQITFGDERCVPPDDKDSNFLMARESLLAHVPIPEGNIFRMKGELAPADGAAEYEARLSAVAARFGEARYVHDLLLLGLGEDGHTASLFPGNPSLDETQRNVIPTIGPKPPPQRLTFTYPLINASREVAFFTKTAGKEQVLQPVLAGDQQYPAARVRPESGKVTWFISA